MIEAVLQCPQPHRWIRLATEDYSAEVEILDSKMLSRGRMEHLFDLQVKPGLADELIAELRRDKDLMGLEALKSKGGHIYGAATSLRCTVCREVAKSNCFLASVGISPKGGARWTVLGSYDSFSGLLNVLGKAGIQFTVRQRRKLEDTDLLTARQEQILAFAFERGYFEFPKKLGLKELAAETGVKTSTLAEILRRGQKKVMGEYLARRSLLHNRE